MLPRELEPEAMDSVEEARAYDAMDHALVNRVFVDDFLAADPPSGIILDLGTGTAQIPIQLCRRAAHAQVWAVDMSPAMLDLGQANLALHNLADRIRLGWADAKALTYDDGYFAAVISNSIVHHVADPLPVLAEAVRVVRPGGLLFFRDLLRPDDASGVEHLVERYAGRATPDQQRLFADSLRAALTCQEMQELVAQLGFSPDTVSVSSDRHWTWSARRPT